MKARKEYYKNLIYKIGLCNSVKSLSEDYYDDFMKLFTNHPEYPEKVKDVVDIKIVRNMLNPKFFELNIVKNNGAIDNISYNSCCVLKHDKHKNLKQAMRHCIYPQIAEYKQNATMVCELCSSTESIEIDHHMNKFQKLFLDFIAENPVLPTSFDDTYYNSPCFKDIDYDWAMKWFDYHKANATLRPLCKYCNGKNK